MTSFDHENYETLEPIEINEETAKNKLLEVLDKPDVPDQVPELITYQSNATEHASEYESNFSFYRLFEPKMVNAKTLELFCGHNTAKQYLKQNNLPGEVIGVDIENEMADIRADVAKLPEKLEPEGQFDIVTSIGAHPGFENFADDAAYLKEDGLYVNGMNEDWLDDKLKESILAWSNGEPDKIEDESVKEASKYFKPVAILKLTGVHEVSDWPDQEQIESDTNKYYFICKKVK